MAATTQTSCLMYPDDTPLWIACLLLIGLALLWGLLVIIWMTA